MFHNDLETIVKEGGNKSIHYLLAQAVDIEKNPREIQYRMILRLKDSNPKSFQEWQTAMEAEIKALNDQDVWELVDLPQNRKPIKCRWVYDIKTCYNHGTDSLHYAILISQTGLVIFLFILLNLAMPLLSYAVHLVLLFFVLLSSLPCYIHDAVLILTLGYHLFTNTYVRLLVLTCI